jgi:tetrapyrrole methylase family protein/MazG family protein
MSKGITIIGLGPNDRRLWTLGAAEVLDQATEIYGQTAYHPSLVDISATVYGFDDLIEQTDNLNEAGEQIAAQIVQLGDREQGVVYAVPGHPFDDMTVPFIRELAQSKNIPATIVPGMSLISAIQNQLQPDHQAGLQIVAAEETSRFTNCCY